MFSINHDLHCHSVASACCEDPKMTTDAILAHAEREGYDMLCLTDHLWDSAVPGASDWYAPQDIEHVRASLPLPKSDKLRFLFGCETEYCGGQKLGLSLEHFDLFDFVVIPPNHMHMIGFVRPKEVTTEEAMAELFTTRLEELTALPLPWRKIGIAHLSCGLLFKEGSVGRVLSLMDEARLMRVFDKLAKGGAGIELNVCTFPDDPEALETYLRIYRFAKKAGNKFYLASDAHDIPALDISKLRAVVDALGLTESDRYLPPLQNV